MRGLIFILSHNIFHLPCPESLYSLLELPVRLKSLSLKIVYDSFQLIFILAICLACHQLDSIPRDLPHARFHLAYSNASSFYSITFERAKRWLQLFKSSTDVSKLLCNSLLLVWRYAFHFYSFTDLYSHRRRRYLYYCNACIFA